LESRPSAGGRGQTRESHRKGGAEKGDNLFMIIQAAPLVSTGFFSRKKYSYVVEKRGQFFGYSFRRKVA